MKLPPLLLAALLTLAVSMTAADAVKPLGEPRVYKKVGDRELKLYIVRPDDWQGGDHRPAIVFFHGGGWANGSPNQFNEHSTYFASRGLVCIQVEYRLVKNEAPLVCIQDARSSMRWVRSHAAELGIDPMRIASAGGSAGGHLAAHVGMADGLDDPKDALAVSAKSNAMLLFNPVLDNGPGQFGAKTIGDRYPEFSPAHTISRDDPPAVLFLGSEDKLIPVSVLETFTTKMKASGVPCFLHVYAGQGHGFFNVKNPKYYRLTVIEADRFLASLGWLRGAPLLQPLPETAAR